MSTRKPVDEGRNYGSPLHVVSIQSKTQWQDQLQPAFGDV